MNHLLQIDCKMTQIPEEKIDEVNLNPCNREKSNCTIFLGYTSNLISSGIRETFCYLAQHNMVGIPVLESKANPLI